MRCVDRPPKIGDRVIIPNKYQRQELPKKEQGQETYEVIYVFDEDNPEKDGPVPGSPWYHAVIVGHWRTLAGWLFQKSQYYLVQDSP